MHPITLKYLETIIHLHSYSYFVCIQITAEFLKSTALLFVPSISTNCDYYFVLNKRQ